MKRDVIRYKLTTVKGMGRWVKICEMDRALWFDDFAFKRGGKGVNDEKLDNNISRARTSVRELAMCNEWQWFATFTLNKDKQDRYNLDAFHKKLAKFISDQNRRRPPEKKITYILVPEKHKDGAWHMHGLMGGLEKSDLYRNKFGYYGWKGYERSFGFLSIGRIKDPDAVIGYVCKYVTKTLAKDISAANAHLYYRSRGLKEPELIFRELGAPVYGGKWDYEHPDGFCRLATVRADRAAGQVSHESQEAAKAAFLEALEGYAPMP